jgi:uncharacterized OB-fold protein
VKKEGRGISTISTVAEPLLYGADDTGAPYLAGMRCRSCGYVDYPAQPFGCQRCGSAERQLEGLRLDPAGSVFASTTVHQHAGNGVTPPFTIAAIKLDSGPVLRGTMIDNTPLPPGNRVTGVLVPVADDLTGVEPSTATDAGTGQETYELRFRKAD